MGADRMEWPEPPHQSFRIRVNTTGIAAQSGTSASHGIRAVPAEVVEAVPAEVAADKAFQNARSNSDKQNARIEHDKAIERAVMVRLADHTELFKQYSDNPSFRKWWQDMVFAQNYDRPME